MVTLHIGVLNIYRNNDINANNNLIRTLVKLIIFMLYVRRVLK